MFESFPQTEIYEVNKDKTIRGSILTHQNTSRMICRKNISFSPRDNYIYSQNMQEIHQQQKKPVNLEEIADSKSEPGTIISLKHPVTQISCQKHLVKAKSHQRAIELCRKYSEVSKKEFPVTINGKIWEISESNCSGLKHHVGLLF